VGILVLSSCAGDYVARTSGARRAYQSYDYNRALSEIEYEVKGPEVDRLLALLDEGMILHAAGRYQESIGVLAEADRLSQQLDVVSISEEAKTLISNERERAYRGEDFEKLMISVLQALNYAELGRDEDALVEVRRVNERLRKMIVDEKKPYEQLAIARYLGGVLWEDQGELDSAFIDYQAAQKLQPNLGPLAEPLIRLARETGRDEAYRELKQEYPDVLDMPLGKDQGQLVVVVEAGLSPIKISAQQRYPGLIQLLDVPKYQDRWPTRHAAVRVDHEEQEATTVTSLGAVAKLHLDDRIGRMVAKAIASTALKAGVAAGVGEATKSRELGLLTFLLLNVNNQADRRSWLSLPAEFQLARFRLPAGRYQVSVELDGAPVQQELDVGRRRVAVAVFRRF
jgi:hypothetical protein